MRRVQAVDNLDGLTGVQCTKILTIRHLVDVGSSGEVAEGVVWWRRRVLSSRRRERAELG